MNPSSNQASGGELPPSIIEPAPIGAGLAEAAPRGLELAPAAPERASTPPTAFPPAPPLMPALNLPLPPTAAAATPQSDTTAPTVSSQSPAVIDDGDLIEKEWVHKAKQIVEKTRDDPYKQTEELTVFKADYMQKRYGKTIKLNQ